MRYAQEKQLPLTVVGPAGIYGPGETRMIKLFRAVRRQRFVMIGSGEIFCHFVYIDDLIQGFNWRQIARRRLGEAISSPATNM